MRVCGSFLGLTTYLQGWPEPYIFTVYDRIFGDFPAKKAVHTPYIYMVLANPTYLPLRQRATNLATGCIINGS